MHINASSRPSFSAGGFTWVPYFSIGCAAVCSKWKLSNILVKAKFRGEVPSRLAGRPADCFPCAHLRELDFTTLASSLRCRQLRMWLDFIPILALTFFFPAEIGAQTTNASCLPHYKWTFNSHKKSPCELASTLLAVCSGGSYMVTTLPTKKHYTGPTLESANHCQCNTVVYSLMSACAACQSRTYETWSVWSGNCATVFINSYPEMIPSNTSVPGWAYLDVKAHDTFNETAARGNINTTESTAIPTPISSSSSSPAPATTSTPTADSVTTSDSNNVFVESEYQVNIIVGSIIGGTFGLVLFMAVGFWYFTSRHHMANSGVPLTPSDGQSVDERNGMGWASISKLAV